MRQIATGHHLGKYHLVAELGRGGAGTVYRAWDPDLERDVAIKVLSPTVAWDAELARRFLGEARIAAKLRHPNIVAIFDVGQLDGLVYIVMEYLPGTSLVALLRQTGALPLSRAVRIVRQMAAALDHAHAHGVVHRDVKPGNAIVGPQDHITLTDFGVARALAQPRVTHEGMIVGTPSYMSPEQAKGEDVTGASDVYSLGIVVYEMLSGRLPYDADTPHALLHAHAYGSPRPLRLALRGAPAGVETAVMRCLAKEPPRRFRTAGAFAEELARCATTVRDTPAGTRGTIVSRHLQIMLAEVVKQAGRRLTGRMSHAHVGTEGQRTASVAVLAALLTIIVVTFVAEKTKPLDRFEHLVSDARAVAEIRAGEREEATLAAMGIGSVIKSPVVTEPASDTLPTVDVDRMIAEVRATLRADAKTEVAGTIAALATSTPEPTTTPTATSSPTRPVSTPTARATAAPAYTISLSSPRPGEAVSDLVEFRWNIAGSMPPSAVFDVQVCKGVNCEPVRGSTNTRETLFRWCPEEGVGNYRWRVRLIDPTSQKDVAPPSGEREFTWTGGCGGDERSRDRQGEQSPQPEPTKTLDPPDVKE